MKKGQTRGRRAWPESHMVDVAIQRLVHSKYKLRHTNSLFYRHTSVPLSRNYHQASHNQD